MKLLPLFVITAVGLSACQKKFEAPPAPDVGAKIAPGGRGRFIAVGLYVPDSQWAQVVGPAAAPGPPPPDPAIATPEDDGQILVVLDSTTGEVRQCGNLSGRCVATNPWSQPAGGAIVGPVTLVRPAPKTNTGN